SAARSASPRRTPEGERIPDSAARIPAEGSPCLPPGGDGRGRSAPSLVCGIRNSCREERARRCALRPEDSERAAEERVVARRHIDEVESLDDRDPRLKQGVVGRMVLVAEMLESPRADPR